MTNTEKRERAMRELQQNDVLMLDGHFDYGNGYHGRVYLNPHALFLHPSTIWRVAQDLLDLMPFDLLEQIDVVAGPATGGALLAHTIAGLLDGRRELTPAAVPLRALQLRPGPQARPAAVLREPPGRPARPARRRRAEHREDVRDLCGPGPRGRRHVLGDGADLRSAGGDRGPRRAELRARRVRRARGTSRPPNARCATPGSRSRRSRPTGKRPGRERASQSAA